MNRGSCLVNLLTLLVLIGMLAYGAVIALILVDPYIALNPFPPSTLPAPFTPVSQVITATPSATPSFPLPLPTFTDTPAGPTARPVTVSATPTGRVVVSPTFTFTPSLTSSLTPTATRTATRPVVVTDTPTGEPVTLTPTRSSLPFTLQEGSPAYTQPFANTAGCNWMGIGGQVFDLNDEPLLGLIVHLEGGGLNQDSVTGTKPAYGDGGYEFFLNDRVVQTTGEYRLQLLDGLGNPLSDIYAIDTFADCNKNLILIFFTQNH